MGGLFVTVIAALALAAGPAFADVPLRAIGPSAQNGEGGAQWCAKGFWKGDRGSCVVAYGNSKRIRPRYRLLAGFVTSRGGIDSFHVCLINPVDERRCIKDGLHRFEGEAAKYLPPIKLGKLILPDAFPMARPGRYEVSIHAAGRRIGPRLWIDVK